MNIKNILVTGGAGFIGSHLVDALISRGCRVRVLDSLDRQIHPSGRLPAYFNKKAEFIRGNVTRRADWIAALKDMEAVVHFAAAVGVGQSMYEVARYVHVNSTGTAILLDLLANGKHKLKKMLVAASMSSYGEGIYDCPNCGKVKPSLRSEEKLKKKDFQVYCPNCQHIVSLLATDENTAQTANSIYAITKNIQEEMVLNIGSAYRIPTVALRFFNVYGPRQSLSNPYNGVAAIFMSRIKNGKAPIINEDGKQTRDFVHVRDVVEACLASMIKKEADYQVFNVGSGKPVNIAGVAEIIIRLYHSKVKPEITGRVRKLDVRHCYADISKISKLLDWTPKISLEAGLKEVITWAENEVAIDRVDEAMRELEKHGLR